MNFDALRRRRATYQRSQTMGSLPVHLLHHQPQSTATTTTTDRRRSSRETPEEDNTIITDSSSTAGLTVDSSPGELVTTRPSTSPRRPPSSSSSPADIIISSTQDGGGGSGGRRSTLERSRSISAVLFTKVKDRIVEKMFQTTTEGPHLAAIVQERRQRAVDAFESRLQTGTLKARGGGGGALVVDGSSGGGGGGGSSRRMRSSLGSSPIKEMTISEEGGTGGVGVGEEVGESEVQERIRIARAAFRRRSVSQDAGQMEMFLQLQQQQPMHERGRTGSDRLTASGSQNLTASASTGSQAFDGIICSNDDFQAILMMGQQDNNSQTTGSVQPCQRPHLSSRAQSFNHGSRVLPDTPPEDRSISSIRGDSGTSPDLKDRENHTDLFPRVASTSGLGSTSPLGGTRPEDLILNLSESAMSISFDDDDDDDDHGGVQRGSKLATVPEIEYDENGQTWDVYGAEFDPEILGDAIQLHLKRLIERKFLDLSQQKTVDGDDDDGDKENRTVSDQIRQNSTKIEDFGKTGRKRFFRTDSNRTDCSVPGSNRFFRYLCAFNKRRNSSDETH